MHLALVMTLCFGLVVSDTEIIAISEGDDVSLAFLKAHNAARANVNVPDLEWSNELSAYAENYAKNCVYGHSYGPYGENLYAGYPKQNDKVTLATNAVNSWVKEIQYVDLPTWNCFTRHDKTTCGHYSQVVWKDTQKVGCAIIHCKTETRNILNNYVICEYEPSGNYIGETPY
ncbi:pathogenesis-related protein 1B [Biomphalaria glabrata]|nr:pathogenesis-related protein 1B-like; partial [Biomphalaria glabrata]